MNQPISLQDPQTKAEANREASSPNCCRVRPIMTAMVSTLLEHSILHKARRRRLRDSKVFREVLTILMETWLASGLVNGEDAAIDTAVFEADAS